MKEGIRKFGVLGFGVVLLMVAVLLSSGVVCGSSLYEFYNSGDDNNTGVYGASWKGQTFTAVGDHEVTGIKLLAYRVGSPGTLTVSVREVDANSHPVGDDLCVGTYSGDSLGDASPGAWVLVGLGGGCSVSDGVKYGVVIRAVGGDVSNQVKLRYDNSAATYAGGCREHSTNSGDTWTAGSAYDLMFEVWGEVSVVPDVVEVLPASDSNYVSTNHTFTATVYGDDENVFEGADVTWNISGVGSIVSCANVTDVDGEATCLITSGEAGNSTVCCSVDGYELFDCGVKEWEVVPEGEPDSVVVYWSWSWGYVGGNYTFYGVVEDSGVGFEGANVTWNISGVGSIVWCANVTDVDGWAGCMVTSNETGNSTVCCSVDGYELNSCGVRLWGNEPEEFVDIPWWYFLIVGVVFGAMVWTGDLVLGLCAVVGCVGGLYWAQCTGWDVLWMVVVGGVFIVLGVLAILFMIFRGRFV